jgi:uncharacterized protein (DUF427 family)
MSVRMRDTVSGVLDQLRHEPTAKRIRAVLGGETVVDSTRAVLLWEPRRVVPTYAVPLADVKAELGPGVATEAAADDVGVALSEVSDRPILDPSIPFGVHSAPGRALDLSAGGQNRPGAAFEIDDPQLAGYVVLEFGAFDRWLEEDEENVSHPKDPFHRIDVLAGARHVRLELDGEPLADSARPVLLFETLLPTRYYLPREDVLAELVPSPTRTWCAYKGQASYYSVVAGGRTVPDLVWTYPEPLHEAARVRDLVCFFNERVEVVLDGVPQPRPTTPWSR